MEMKKKKKKKNQDNWYHKSITLPKALISAFGSETSYQLHMHGSNWVIKTIASFWNKNLCNKKGYNLTVSDIRLGLDTVDRNEHGIKIPCNT